MEKYDAILDRVREKYSDPFGSQNSILQLFHEAGFSISEAIKGLRALCKISLSEAKNMVAESRIWESEEKAGADMQATAIDIFEEKLEYERPPSSSTEMS